MILLYLYLKVYSSMTLNNRLNVSLICRGVASSFTGVNFRFIPEVGNRGPGERAVTDITFITVRCLR